MLTSGEFAELRKDVSELRDKVSTTNGLLWGASALLGLIITGGTLKYFLVDNKIEPRVQRLETFMKVLTQKTFPGGVPIQFNEMSKDEEAKVIEVLRSFGYKAAPTSPSASPQEVLFTLDGTAKEDGAIKAVGIDKGNSDPRAVQPAGEVKE